MCVSLPRSHRETGCEAPILMLSFFGESITRRSDAATCSHAEVCWHHCSKDGEAPVLGATIRWGKRELTTVCASWIHPSVGVTEVKVTDFLLRGRGEWPEVLAELGLVGVPGSSCLPQGSVKRLQPEILTSKDDKNCPQSLWCP